MIELFVFYEYRMLFSLTAIIAILDTNAFEAAEFFATYKVALFCLFIALLVGIIALYLLLSVLLSRLKASALRHAGLIGAFTLLLCALGVLAMLIMARYINQNPFAYDLTSLDRLYTKLYTLYGSELARPNDINLHHKLTLLNTKNERNINIVLIIGESSNRHHYHLYGYSLPTTPRLDALAKSGELVKYSDVISPDIGTSGSLTKVLTTLHEGEEGRWMSAPNLIDTFAQAGFATAWLSNQEARSIFTSARYVYTELAALAGHYANTSGKLAGSDVYKYWRVDGRLLPLLDAIVPLWPKSLLTIHLLGQHVAYNRRYPSTFDTFHASDYSDALLKKLGEKKLAVRATYDNAILYGDYVLDEIYKRVKSEDTIVVFISDHAEEVGDSKDGFMGRRLSRTVVEIPFFVMASGAFQARHKRLMEQIRAAKDKPFMSDDLIYYLLSLGNIKIKELLSDEMRLSPLSPEYVPHKRVVKKMRYDK